MVTFTSSLPGDISDDCGRSPATLLECALVDMDRLAVRQVFLDSGLTPLYFREQVIAPALCSIAERWDRGELSLSHVCMSGRICDEFMEQSLEGRRPVCGHGERAALALLEDYHLPGGHAHHQVAGGASTMRGAAGEGMI